ncbi:uncharacterized protein LOC129869719 [Solanum dulcamara]|uniref:uncharacterized protein LOC129869719 n=1 Tax=Solanum dulcamara TaxID=45834 RepID=UPI0024857FB3|nr:uncharacterized protein LOC129869719 [Solanum dulcamara]
MPTGKLAKWQILLSEFDIEYVTQKAIKGQALADHLAENTVDKDYEPLKTYFHDEEVLFIGEDMSELCDVDYFTKWVEASTYKAVTKKVVADFVRNNVVCRFGIPESIIIDNFVNLNSDIMKEICKRFKIAHRNSISYRPQMNGAVEAANKNIKKILRKIVDSKRQWHKKLPYALLGYCTKIRTFIGTTLCFAGTDPT